MAELLGRHLPWATSKFKHHPGWWRGAIPLYWLRHRAHKWPHHRFRGRP